MVVEQFGRQIGNPFFDGGLLAALKHVAVMGFKQTRGAFIIASMDGIVNRVVERAVLLEPDGCGAVEWGCLFWGSLLAQKICEQGMVAIPGRIEGNDEQVGAFDVFENILRR